MTLLHHWRIKWLEIQPINRHQVSKIQELGTVPAQNISGGRFAFKMTQDINEIIKLIESLRGQLEDLTQCRGSRYDPEVLTASQNLDTAINDYYRYYTNTKPQVCSHKERQV